MNDQPVTLLSLYTDDDLFIDLLRKENPTKQPMTIERLRSYVGCTDYTDEEAENVISLLTELAAAILENECNLKASIIDNQCFVSSCEIADSKKVNLYSEQKNLAA